MFLMEVVVLVSSDKNANKTTIKGNKMGQQFLFQASDVFDGSSNDGIVRQNRNNNN